MKNKLKIFSPDVSLNSVVEENLLYLGKVSDDIISNNKTFRELKSSEVLEYIDYTDLNNCDFILYPQKVSKNSDISDLIDKSIKLGKKIILFYNDDNDEVFNFDNSLIFRTSLYKSSKPKNYLSVPAFSNDLKKEINYFYREKKETPTIGFCGALTHHIRSKVISKFNSFNNVNRNVIVRNSFWGGNVWGDKVRKEYIENTLSSDFVLCVRGSGNFSYRLYETMCLGRIPLIIDTDIDLPFENYLSYENKILKISIDELDKIEDYILKYWNNVNDYLQLQKDIINFWESHLSPIGFIKTLNNHKNEINNLLH